MRRKGLFIAGALLLLAGGAWWLGDGKPVAVPGPEAPASGEPVSGFVDLDQAPEEAAFQATDEAGTADFARRLPHVPGWRPAQITEGPTTDERDVTAENIDTLVHANLEHALEGDMASGYFVTRSRMACDRVAATPEELERDIRRVNRRVEGALARGRELPATADTDRPWSFTGDMEANRAHLQRWYDACQRLRGIFTPDLRRRLELQALDGNVMARYLYASWPEDELDAGEAFDRQFRWERLARDFSMANLQSGEVAGLMAFGQSYLSGWFTARNGNLALAFGVAALNCGFQTISQRSYLADNIERLTSSEDPADHRRLQFILAESDRLGRFCTF